MKTHRPLDNAPTVALKSSLKASLEVGGCFGGVFGVQHHDEDRFPSTSQLVSAFGALSKTAGDFEGICDA